MDSILRNQLQVFLCHASEDKSAIRGLYSNLRGDGFAPWLDEEHLLPGEDFDLRIRETVRTSDVVLACLSKKTITKSGYIQKELRYALDIADEQPEGAVYIIPVRLEQCKVPERLRKWQWVDLFTKDGYSQLIRTLETRARAKFAVNPTGKLDVSHSFALDQLHIETSSKVLAAKWVVQNMELKVGAGVFLDAGSSCLLLIWLTQQGPIGCD